MDSSAVDSTAPVNAARIATKSFRGAASLFQKDLEALPEDCFTKSFGPNVRTVADIVFEVNMVNDHIGMVVRGEKPFEWPEEGWIKAPATFSDKKTIIEAFVESSGKLASTFDGYTSEQLCERFQTDEGETDRFERARFATLHIWYHSGQLNFIQTLIGDDAWHWQ